MSTLYDDDLFVVQDGSTGETSFVQNSNRSSLQDDDLFIVNRGGELYHVKSVDVGSGGGTSPEPEPEPDPAPVIDAITQTQESEVNNNRFTGNSFKTQVSSTGGAPVINEMTAYVEGSMAADIGSDPIATNNYSGGSTVPLTLSGTANLEENLLAGDAVKANVSYQPQTSEITNIGETDYTPTDTEISNNLADIYNGVIGNGAQFQAGGQKVVLDKPGLSFTTVKARFGGFPFDKQVFCQAAGVELSGNTDANGYITWTFSPTTLNGTNNVSFRITAGGGSINAIWLDDVMVVNGQPLLTFTDNTDLKFFQTGDEIGQPGGTQPKLYSGNDTTQSITGIGFSPDFVWLKSRTLGSASHGLFDSVRGATKRISSDANSAQSDQPNTLQSFDEDGFTIGSDAAYNSSSNDFVAWCWDAGNNAPVANTNGTITSSVKASDTTGFSIVSYTGNGGLNQTVGHGLSTKPSLIFYKDLEGTTAWRVIPTFVNDKYYLALNSSDAIFTTATQYFGDTTDSVLGITGSESGINNTNNRKYIAYCWAETPGVSKFGSYSGTGGTNSIKTGFEPAWLMIRHTNSADDWIIVDRSRGENVYLVANNTTSEGVYEGWQFDSDGFTLLQNGSSINASGGEYIYAAFSKSAVNSVVSVDPANSQMVVDGGNYAGPINDSQRWSDGCSGAPQDAPDYGRGFGTSMFDGSLETSFGGVNTPVQWDGSIEFTDSFAMAVANDGQSLSADKIVITHAGGTTSVGGQFPPSPSRPDNDGPGKFTTVTGITSPVTRIVFNINSGYYVGCFGIKADGSVLVDAVNDDEKWSSYGSGVPYTAGRTWEVVFDGKISGVNDGSLLAGTNQTMSWIPTTPLPVTDSVVIYLYNQTNLSTHGCKVNDQFIPATAGYGFPVELTAAELGGQLESVKIITSNTATGAYLTAIELDGALLADPGISGPSGQTSVSTLAPKQGEGTIDSINGADVVIDFVDNCFVPGQYLIAQGKTLEVCPRSDQIQGYDSSAKVLTFATNKDLAQFGPSDPVKMTDVDGNDVTYTPVSNIANVDTSDATYDYLTLTEPEKTKYYKVGTPLAGKYQEVEGYLSVSSDYPTGTNNTSNGAVDNNGSTYTAARPWESSNTKYAFKWFLGAGGGVVPKFKEGDVISWTMNSNYYFGFNIIAQGHGRLGVTENVNGSVKTFTRTLPAGVDTQQIFIEHTGPSNNPDNWVGISKISINGNPVGVPYAQNITVEAAATIKVVDVDNQRIGVPKGLDWVLNTEEFTGTGLSGTGTIENTDPVNNTVTFSSTNGQWVDDYYISLNNEDGCKPAATSKAFLQFDSSGAVTGYQATPVAPLVMNDLYNNTLTFPDSFDGLDSTPDDEFSDTNARIITTVKLTNATGSDEATADGLVPTTLTRSAIDSGSLTFNTALAGKMYCNILTATVRKATKTLIEAEETVSEVGARLTEFVNKIQQEFESS